jgi:hypothetical protein
MSIEGNIYQLLSNKTQNNKIYDDNGISFFKIKNTEEIEYKSNLVVSNFNKNINFDGSGTCNIKKGRNLELLYNIYLLVKLPSIKIKYKRIKLSNLSALLLYKYNLSWEKKNDENIFSKYIHENELISIIYANVEKIKNNINNINYILTKIEYVYSNNINNENKTGELYVNLLGSEILGDYKKKLYDIIINYKNNTNINKLYTSDDILYEIYNKYFYYVISKNIYEDHINEYYMDENLHIYNNIDFINPIYINNNNIMTYIINNLNLYYNNEEYKNYDVYITTQKYFAEKNIDIINVDVGIIISDLLINVKWNIKKNIIQIINILKMLLTIKLYGDNDNINTNHYIIGYYKIINYGNDSSADFSNLINSKNENLLDNFSKYLLNTYILNEPDNITYLNYDNYNDILNEYITLNIDIFSKYNEYFKYQTFWKKLYLKNLHEEYITTEYNNIFLLNLIPILIITDIPKLVSYILNNGTYINTILEDYENNIDTIKNNILSIDENDKILLMDIIQDSILNKNNIKISSYLGELEKIRASNPNNVIIVGLFAPEQILTILPNIENENCENILSIDYIILYYLGIYYNNIEQCENLYDNNINTKNSLKTYIAKIIKTFKCDENITYDTYINNGYLVYNVLYSDIEKITINTTEYIYSDISSSIWYNILNEMITKYNYTMTNKIIVADIFKNNGYFIKKCFDNHITKTLYEENVIDDMDDEKIKEINYYKLRTISDDTINSKIIELNKIITYTDNIFDSYDNNKKLLKIRDINIDKIKYHYSSFEKIYSLLIDDFSMIYYDNVLPSNISDIIILVEQYFNNIDIYGMYDYIIDLRNNIGDDTDVLNYFDNTLNNISDENTNDIYKNIYKDILYDGLNNNHKVYQYILNMIINEHESIFSLNDIIPTNFEKTYLNIKKTYSDKYNKFSSNLLLMDVNDKYENSPLYIELNEYLIDGTPKFAWQDNIGYKIINEISLMIGDILYDKYDGEWLYIKNMIHNNINHNKSINYMIGNIDEMTTFDNNKKNEYMLYVPILFWFNSHHSQMLPVINLLHNDININLKINDLYSLCKIDNNIDHESFIKNSIIKCELLTEYISLPTNEIKKMVNDRMNKIIEYVRVMDKLPIKYNKNKIIINIPFDKLCKYMIWIFKVDKINNIDNTNFYKYYDIDGNIKKIVKNIQLNVNNKSLEKNKNEKYYNIIQIINKHASFLDENMYMYSFSLYPLISHQPSGHVNLGKLGNIDIICELCDDIYNDISNNNIELSCKIYGIFYDVMTIMSGMSTLLFSY